MRCVSRFPAALLGHMAEMCFHAVYDEKGDAVMLNKIGDLLRS
jgi:hypothetical protein